jgi:hypothetical protein
MSLNAHRGFSLPELHEAFDRATKENASWRDPIDAWVRDTELSVTRAAIHYFTACEAAEVARVRDSVRTLVRLTAAGYRNGPAGP